MVLRFLWTFLLFMWIVENACTQTFSLVNLGCSGGIRDNNLSSWLVKPIEGNRYLLLDAGSLVSGIEIAVKKGNLSLGNAPDSVATIYWLLQEGIEGCFISHPHFDHIAGLIAISPDDGAKPVFASENTLNLMNKHVFNNVMWANFSDQGVEPRLAKYRFETLVPFVEEAVGSQGVSVTLFPLSHGSMESSAFLLKHHGHYLLYLGDTGADGKERSNRLERLWTDIAPLIAAGTLEMVVVEVSYPDPRPDPLLFGHLTPALLAGEIGRLKNLIGGEDPENMLNKVLFVITHVKPVAGKLNTAVVQRQLQSLAVPGFRFVMAEQGERYENNPSLSD